MQSSTLAEKAKVEAHQGELLIDIWRDFMSVYRGSRQQLEDEGLIPDGFLWPAGTARATWTAGGMEYELRRVKQPGCKGPMRIWAAGDFWRVEVMAPGRNFITVQSKRLRRMEEDLARERQRLSAAGQLDWTRQLKLAVNAASDDKFQHFKSLIPGLAAQKPGRKPKKQAVAES